MRAYLFSGVAAISVLIAGAAPAVAQEAGANASPQNADADDIVVTAQRVSERLQDVPLSVQAVGASTLRDNGINELRQLSILAPSLQTQRDNNYAIRGIGTQSFANTIESSVATAVDDVTLGSRFNNGNPFIDVAQVEILNGPQGLLFGKNASAGLVNITTVKPKIGMTEGSIDLQASSNDVPGVGEARGFQARSILNLPVSDSSALRLNAVYTIQEPTILRGRRNATGRNDTNFSQVGGRLKYLYESGEKFSLYLLGEYFASRGVGTIFDITYFKTAPASLNNPSLAADGVTPGPLNFRNVTDGPHYRDLDTGGAQATAAYKFDSGFTLTNTLAWKFYDLSQQLDSDFTGGDATNINRNNSRFDQFSNELRLALPSENRLSGQVGLYYYHSKLHQDAQVGGNVYAPTFVYKGFPFCVGAVPATPSPPNCSVSNVSVVGRDSEFTTRNTSYAAFGQFTFKVSDQFKLIAGGRYTHDRVAIDLAQNRQRYWLTLGLKNAAYNQSYSTGHFSWKLGVQYKPSEDVMLYANYGVGHKGPGMNDTGATPAADLTIFPETSKTAEAGIKTSLLDRAVTFNLSIFHTRFDNFQIQSFDAALLAFVIGNASQVKSEGAEGSIQIRPVEGLTLTAAASYANTRFGSYAGAQCYPAQPGCSASGTFSAAGRTLPYAPRFTSSLGARYEHRIGETGVKGFLDLNLYSRSKIETVVSHAPDTQIGALSILSATLGFKADNWNLAFYCKNCTNKVYPISKEIDPADAAGALAPAMLTIQQRFSLDSARSFGLRFGYNF